MRLDGESKEGIKEMEGDKGEGEGIRRDNIWCGNRVGRITEEGKERKERKERKGGKGNEREYENINTSYK